jgi:hypothetical protein
MDHTMKTVLYDHENREFVFPIRLALNYPAGRFARSVHLDG